MSLRENSKVDVGEPRFNAGLMLGVLVHYLPAPLPFRHPVAVSLPSPNFDALFGFNSIMYMIILCPRLAFINPCNEKLRVFMRASRNGTQNSIYPEMPSPTLTSKLSFSII